MSFSNSFDAEFSQPSASSWSAHEPSLGEPSLEATETSPYLHWQEQLLPLSCVAQEDNLSVLRMELETAHQLLQYQQVAIDALREQMVNRDLHLQHAQVEQANAQQTCERQAAELAELGAICRDLKMQLRRQQQRVLQYRNVLKGESLPRPVSLPHETVSTTTVVAFGYEEAIAVESHPAVPQPSAGADRPAAVKPLPVKTWSAPGSIDLTGPLACYRKLATIRMTTASVRLETRPRSAAPPEADRAAATRASQLPSSPAASPRVELPSFTRSASH